MKDMNRILMDVLRISQLENKTVLDRVLKFNEEFGEFAAEIVKMQGLTHKPYDEEHLIEEGADALIVLTSIIMKICNEKKIDFNRFLEKMDEKNIIWESKIPGYVCNQPVKPSIIKYKIWCKGTHPNPNFDTPKWFNCGSYILNKYFNMAAILGGMEDTDFDEHFEIFEDND